MNYWQPIETAPRDYTTILGVRGGEYPHYWLVWWDGDGWDDGTFGERPNPSHWVPIPGLPPQ